MTILAMPLSTREGFQRSWSKVLANFRQWILADMPDLVYWQSRPLPEAIKACPGKMVDDVVAMIKEYRTSVNTSKGGNTALLPVMLTAFDSGPNIPDVSTLRGIPDWFPAVIPSDPQQRIVQMRTMPVTIRAQVVFLTANAHSGEKLVRSFCSYFSSETKRRFQVRHHLGGGIYEDWPLTVFENILYPESVTVEERNLFVFKADVNFSGDVPEVVGLGSSWDLSTDPEGRPDPHAMQPMTTVEIDSGIPNTTNRWVADPVTGESWLETFTTGEILASSVGDLINVNGLLLRLV